MLSHTLKMFKKATHPFAHLQVTTRCDLHYTLAGYYQHGRLYSTELFPNNGGHIGVWKGYSTES